jgi:hypothetical protein
MQGAIPSTKVLVEPSLDYLKSISQECSTFLLSLGEFACKCGTLCMEKLRKSVEICANECKCKGQSSYSLLRVICGNDNVIADALTIQSDSMSQ